MFAIVEVAGQQFKVEKNDRIFVHRLQEKEGDKIVLDQVLLVEEKGKTLVGTPVVKEYQVKATVLTHLKGDKVKVFKKKRRKGYQKLNGHRQLFTEIQIDAIEKARSATRKTAAQESKAEKKETEKPAAKAKAPSSRAKATETKKAEAAGETTKTTTAKKSTRTTAARKSTGTKAAKTAGEEKKNDKKEEK